jgi:hypothetical protein
LKLHALFQTIKSSFRVSERWRPREGKFYREYKEFKERKRAELELIRREETIWQKFVRYATGYSPLRSNIVQSSNIEDKY